MIDAPFLSWRRQRADGARGSEKCRSKPAVRSKRSIAIIWFCWKIPAHPSTVLRANGEGIY